MQFVIGNCFNSFPYIFLVLCKLHWHAGPDDGNSNIPAIKSLLFSSYHIITSQFTNTISKIRKIHIYVLTWWHAKASPGYYPCVAPSDGKRAERLLDWKQGRPAAPSQHHFIIYMDVGPLIHTTIQGKPHWPQLKVLPCRKLLLALLYSNPNLRLHLSWDWDFVYIYNFWENHPSETLSLQPPSTALNADISRIHHYNLGLVSHGSQSELSGDQGTDTTK